MATNAERRPRSLEVQRAQAEERRQRLDEQKHQLEVSRFGMEKSKHEVEKTRISVEVLKHFTFVIIALLFLLAYFGDQMISSLQRINPVPALDVTAWDVGVMGLALTLAFSFFGLISFALNPEQEGKNPIQRIMFYVMFAILVIAVAAVIEAVAVIGLTP